MTPAPLSSAIVDVTSFDLAQAPWHCGHCDTVGSLFTRCSSTNALDLPSDFGRNFARAQSGRARKGPCTGAGPVAQNWPAGSTAASGTLYCFTGRDGPVVAWSDDRPGKVTLSVVGGSGMRTLYQWWSVNH